MVEIIIKNRAQARRDSYEPTDKTIGIISINTPCDELNRFNRCSSIRKVLFLIFDDVEYEGQERGLFMTNSDAEKVKEFVLWAQKANIDELWVHCDAGVSRSAGVGAAIMQYLYGDDSPIFGNHNYFPNMWCYHKTLNALKGDVDGKDKRGITQRT